MSSLKNTPSAPAPSQLGGAGLGAVPDSNTLLAYKLLKDSWGDANVFGDLLKEEMKYLVAGISLLNQDPYLAMKMGGVTLNAAGQLAAVIKQKEQELDISARIDPVAKSILVHKFAKPAMTEMLPGRRNAVALVRDNQNNVKMSFKAGYADTQEINMGDAIAANGLDALLTKEGGNVFNGLGSGIIQL